MTIFEDEVDANTNHYSYGTACKGDFLALNLALLSDDESDADSTSDVQEAPPEMINEKDKDMEWCSDFDPHALSVDDAFSVAAVSDWETDTTMSVKPPPGLSLPPWMMPSRSAVQSD